MRIVFFGSGEFGVPCLAALHRDHELALVVTQPDRPAGRHRRLAPTPVAAWAQRMNLALLKPEKVNDPAVQAMIQMASPDANVVIAFGQKIGPAIIASPALGPAATVNLHASLLPLYRGAAPIHRAMIAGETRTGNTVFSLVEKMDAGPILGSQATPIDPLETAGELHDRLARLGADLVGQVLAGLQAGSITPQSQDDSRASLAPKLGKTDATIDFAADAMAIRCRVHGMTPWPGVTVWHAGDAADRQPLMLRRVESLPDRAHAAEPGRMIEDGLLAAGRGAVRLLEVQPPGKRTMSWGEYSRGRRWGRDVRFHGS
jgi:methionyl-tRNA formyltransferase